MLFAPERQMSTSDTVKPPFKPHDRVRVVSVPGAPAWASNLLGKTGTVLDASALPVTDPRVPGHVWLQVHVDNAGTVPLLDTEIELLPKPQSAIALDICHR